MVGAIRRCRSPSIGPTFGQWSKSVRVAQGVRCHCLHRLRHRKDAGSKIKRMVAEKSILMSINNVMLARLPVWQGFETKTDSNSIESPHPRAASFK